MNTTCISRGAKSTNVENTDKASKAKFGFEVLTLRATLRGAYSLLQSATGYGAVDATDGDLLTDVGFALGNADMVLTNLYDRLDEMGIA